MRKLFLWGLAALMAICSFGSLAEAKELPKVVWTKDVYSIKDEFPKEWHLLTDKSQSDRIVEAITQKLEQQKDKLPFQLAGGSDEKNWKVALDSPIAMIPIVVTDATFRERYTVKDKTLHKYVMVTALDIAFCSVEEGNSLRLLSNIPLHFFTVLPESNRIEEMNELSQAELSEIYTQFTVKMIQEHLDFVKERRLLKNIEDKTESITDTYQVGDVKISSKKGQELFQGRSGDYLKKVIGDIYSSAYGRRTGHVVYPSRLSGNWIHDAAKGVWVNEYTSFGSGEETITMKAPDHEVTLDVTGMGNQEVKTKKESNVNGFMAYKVWLKKSPKDEKDKMDVVTNSTVEEFIKAEGAAIEKEESEIYSKLLIGAAQNLGDQKTK